jgi:lysyl-tRNA synthetase class 1
MTLDPKLINQLKLWPWREAARLQKGLRGKEAPAAVIFETGYGPSGLPHIGTFAEVARTTWVRQAFAQLDDTPTALFAFSDNVDGLRQIPTNLPNREMLVEHLGKPLCDIPDPFGQQESFSGYMNHKLREFLDRFGFEYSFKASHEHYRGGAFNDGLLRVLERYEKVRGIILPTLSPENREAWSPFMPVCPNCGKLNTTRVVATHPERGELSFVCDQGEVERVEKDGIWTWRGCQPCGFEATAPVTDGHAKVGWKVDWALRWFTFGVHYEMYGKDLIDSAELSGKICRALGGTPPEGMFYEMFLDREGAKISKSKGNGLTIDEWLTYGPLESLAMFIAKRPEQASRLYFGTIPQHVDEYLQHLTAFPTLSAEKRYNSPIWFLRHREVVGASQSPGYVARMNYGTLLNLVSALNTEDREVVWDYVRRYDPAAEQERALMDELIDLALVYYRDEVLPHKVIRQPPAQMRPAVDDFLAWLEGYAGREGGEIQDAAYEVCNRHEVDKKAFFQTMYELLLGDPQGPRLGNFVQLYGVQETLALARARLTAAE